MGKMKELAIALMRGDSLSELSEAERNYVSTLSPAEYAELRGQDHSFDEYQEYRYLVEKEQNKKEK